MRKSKTSHSPDSYSYPKSSLATIVDKQTMEQIYRDLENPTGGTVSLNKLLKQIERDKNA